MKESELNEEIFSRYGAVTRARGCFLYTKKGVRLTDMYQSGGRAILGWGGGDAFSRFKNILNRGVTGSFLTEYTPQINRAVGKLLGSDRKVLFYADKQTALKSALAFSPESTGVWKPWGAENVDWAGTDCVVFAPPLPWTDTIWLVAVDKALYERKVMDAESSRQIPTETAVPSPLIAAITRSIYDLILAIQTREEKNWFIYDTVLTRYFERKGPYLYPKLPEIGYDDFVRHCLDSEIVISPFYNAPSIVPFGADKGVFTKLKKSEFVYAAD